MALILAPLGGEKRRDIKKEDGCRGQHEERITADRADEEVSGGGIVMAIAEKAGVGKNGHVVKGSTLGRPKGGGAQSQRRERMLYCGSNYQQLAGVG